MRALLQPRSNSDSWFQDLDLNVFLERTSVTVPKHLKAAGDVGQDQVQGEGDNDVAAAGAATDSSSLAEAGASDED